MFGVKRHYEKNPQCAIKELPRSVSKRQNKLASKVFLLGSKVWLSLITMIKCLAVAGCVISVILGPNGKPLSVGEAKNHVEGKLQILYHEKEDIS